MRLGSLLARFQKTGFEGPFYRGVRGKARFLFESIAWRTEFIFAGTRESFASVRAPASTPVTLTQVTSFEELEIFRSQLEEEYFHGYLETWRSPFTWGERVVIGTISGRLAAFAWVQRGTQEGFATPYGRLFEKDARILRVGVVPTFRRQGLNSTLMRGVLEGLLGEGFERVFAESHKYNVPSVRTFLRVGFRAVAAITVMTVPGGGEYIRWSHPGDAESHLRELGINFDATTS